MTRLCIMLTLVIFVSFSLDDSLAKPQNMPISKIPMPGGFGQGQGHMGASGSFNVGGSAGGSAGADGQAAGGASLVRRASSRKDRVNCQWTNGGGTTAATTAAPATTAASG